MGKRGRQREKLTAPTTDYTAPDGEMTLTLRGAMSPATRREYAQLMTFGTGPAQTREDLWQRGVEFLFERLVVAWTVTGVATTTQKELLQRFRFASSEERAWIRDVLREHLAEWFPDVEAP
jgi:hypothetical protein